MSRFAWLALSTLLLVAGCAKEQPVEVHGTVERDRLEIIAESNERIVEMVREKPPEPEKPKEPELEGIELRTK